MSIMPRMGKCLHCGHDHGNGFGDERLMDAIKRIAELEALLAVGAPSVADAAGASEDARDAARYRYLRNAVGVILDCSHAGPWKFGEAVDKQLDEWLERKAAIAKESGNDVDS